VVTVPLDSSKYYHILMRRKDFELAFESKYKDLQLVLKCAGERRGRPFTLRFSKAMFCVATLIVGEKYWIGPESMCSLLC